ncbi:MAG: hypothetical protein [Microviridae sp.]|nr:MAG: hypothetical protein [Microviridae sp.]
MAKNQKTPKIDDLTSGDTKISQKRSSNDVAENASNLIGYDQKKLSTPIFKTHYSHLDVVSKGEPKSLLPDLAVPNQSMSIKEIYLRYASGRPLAGLKTPDFDDDGNRKYALDFDDYMPNLDKLDLADRQQILEDAKAHLDTVKRKLDAAAKAKKRIADDKEKELSKRLKALEQKEANPSTPSVDGV